MRILVVRGLDTGCPFSLQSSREVRCESIKWRASTGSFICMTMESMASWLMKWWVFGLSAAALLFICIQHLLKTVRLWLRLCNMCSPWWVHHAWCMRRLISTQPRCVIPDAKHKLAILVFAVLLQQNLQHGVCRTFCCPTGSSISQGFANGIGRWWSTH